MCAITMSPAADPSPPLDFFIAYAGPDAETASRLFELLSRQATAFAAPHSLLPGDDWDQELPRAVHRAKVTVVLVSQHTDEAFYQREEIAQAIELARSGSHRVVPVWLTQDPGTIPYGLRVKHRIEVAESTTMEQVTEELLRLVGPTWPAALSIEFPPTGGLELAEKVEAACTRAAEAIRHVGVLTEQLLADVELPEAHRRWPVHELNRFDHYRAVAARELVQRLGGGLDKLVGVSRECESAVAALEEARRAGDIAPEDALAAAKPLNDLGEAWLASDPVAQFERLQTELTEAGSRNKTSWGPASAYLNELATEHQAALHVLQGVIERVVFPENERKS